MSDSKTTPAPFSVTKSYLMWVGAEHYDTIEDYAGEVVKQGVSKRLSNVHMARTLMEPGAVIFLAHDEHSYVECEECTGTVECGECRKREQERQRIERECEELELKLSDAEKSKRDFAQKAETEKDGEALAALVELEEKAAKEVKRLRRLLNNRFLKQSALREERKVCELCNGRDIYTGGTGGKVVVDGEIMDYRTYNYWLHQPKKWSATGKEISTEMCETCGGTGRLPEGKVFGCLLPSDVEYILKDDEGDDVKSKIEAEGFSTVTETEVKMEARRGCGKRHSGGYYLRTGTKEREADVKALIEKLVKDGAVEPDGVEVIGTFVRFLNAIEIPGVKRFRGLKTWSLDPAAEEEVEMAVEALSEAA